MVIKEILFALFSSCFFRAAQNKAQQDPNDNHFSIVSGWQKKDQSDAGEDRMNAQNPISIEKLFFSSAFSGYYNSIFHRSRWSKKKKKHPQTRQHCKAAIVIQQWNKFAKSNRGREFHREMTKAAIRTSVYSLL